MEDNTEEMNENITPEITDRERASQWEFTDLHDDATEGVTTDDEAEDVDSEASDDVDSEASNDGEEQAEQKPHTKKYRLNIQGQERELSLEELAADKAALQELIDSGMRTNDYTKKTQELVETRKEVNTEKERLSAEKEKLAAEYQAAEQILGYRMAELANTNWVELQNKDPAEFSRLWALNEQMKRDFHHVRSVNEQIAQERSQAAAQHFNKMMEEGARAMLDKQSPYYIPGIETEEVRKELATAAITHGFSQEEVDQNTDPRLFKLAWKAAQWDKYQASQKTVKEKLKKTPVKVEKPGNTTDADLPKKIDKNKLRQIAKYGNSDQRRKAERELANNIDWS